MVTARGPEPARMDITTGPVTSVDENLSLARAGLSPLDSTRAATDTGSACTVQVAVPKEYNIRRHYETHQEKYNDYTGQRAVKASYVIAWEIAKASKPFSEGEFVRTCMIKAAELVCPENRQALANISLSRPTVTERVEELSSDLHSQLKEKIKSFVAFSIALDESTDVTDTAQLAIFIRGVDAALNVTEEFVSVVPMTDTTTANDVFVSLVGALDNLEVDWSRAVSVATDGAPSMVGRKAGVVVKARGLNHRQFDAFLFENDIHHGLPYHTDVRWLSRGAVLKRFYKLRNEIAEFMQAKGKPVEELDDPEWTRDLAFLVDITEHLNVLNVTMQGRNKLVTEYYDSVRAFQIKLSLWKAQLSQRNAAHFPCLKSLHVNHQSMDKYASLLSGLMGEFSNRFTVFTELEKDFSLFRSPFTTDASEVPEGMQMELIDLQCCARLKDTYASVGIESFYQSLPPEYPIITAFADAHLNDVVKIATAQSLSPNVDKLVKTKRLLASTCKM
ncbi:general transcription factor II-I repeat domain-containing protein 2-like [Odontesthes bonariensis]|uniref:general transcription factor II-I repeat domain-containing protein 2-like n=1 Tax=Odontesthes bonariensis TaxID=219752 RepID=UPI003F585933